MSADNAILVKKTRDGKFSSQMVFMSAPAWPEADDEGAQVFDTLEELFEKTAEEASETEYGYQVHI